MAEYNIDFSAQMISAAEAVLRDSDGGFDTAQAVTYLSLLSCEIALKALLEKAGVPTALVRSRSHNLSLLLDDVCNCQVPKSIAQLTTHWGQGTGIRAKSVQDGTFGTVGQVLDMEENGASRYPDQIRYGSKYSHFPPEVVLKSAKQVQAWAREHWETIRKPLRQDSLNNAVQIDTVPHSTVPSA